MLTGFFLFFLLGSAEVSEGFLKRCPPLRFLRHGIVTCSWKNVTVNCASNTRFGSIAKFTCEEFYKLSVQGQSLLQCMPNGRWSSAAPECIPDCGRRSSSVSLIVNGVAVKPGIFPWHVAIYNLVDGSYEYWCGGSLISDTSVVTAAHCTWEIPPENLMLAFGKFHREYDFAEKQVQKIKARKIEMLASFQDAVGDYDGDVAVIFLARPVTLSLYSAPVCIDWDQQLMDKHLTEGSSGVVLGWGLTENDTLSESLRALRIPVVSDKRCIAEQDLDFRKFITSTSFCAGFKNGTGVCNGDSGGGLTFFDEVSDRWYLQGLVSVSPRRKETPFCDPNFYTVFTKISMYSKWLNAAEKWSKKLNPENENPQKELFAKGKTVEDFYAFIRKYFDQESYEIGGGKNIYPHSKKMLQLAQFFKPFEKF